MSDSLGSVILAAGEGTRLKLALPKPLAPVSGRAVVDFPIRACDNFAKKSGLDSSVNVVVGHARDLVEAHIKKTFPTVQCVVQERQLGTGDALRCYFDQSPKAKKMTYTIVMCGDTPLITEREIQKMYDHLKDKNLDGVTASFVVEGEHQYGRIVRGTPGFRIVEHKDANETIRKINEVNSAFYIFKTAFILEHIDSLNTNNAAGEFYLTDLFQDQFQVEALLFKDPKTFHGINDLYQLQKAETYLMSEKIKSLMDAGVRFTDPSHTYVDDEVTVGAGTCVSPNVFLQGKTSIGKDCVIEPGAILINATLKDGATVRAYSHVEEAIIGEEVVIGPFARLRPGTELGKGCKIGNFVELKKAKLEEGVKASHLAYVGDAEVGARTNISCGVITCNYDGANKHKTIIGADSFVGSDSQLIAPITLGKESYVASGSTINKDVPDGGFAIARGRQETKEGLAKRFLKKK